MDLGTAATAAQIAFGHAIGGVIVGSFYSWKAKRPEVRMVRNRRGDYVDVADVYMRRATIAWCVVVVSVLTVNGYFFVTMP